MILGFDLSSFSCTLALCQKQPTGEIVPVAQDEILSPYEQDTQLIPKILSLLNENNVTFDDLKAIVTTTGPGSFTGIRVALATAQGLSLAAGCPALGFSVFDWLTFCAQDSLNAQDPLCWVLESRRPELYVQFHDQKPEMLTPQEIADRYGNTPLQGGGSGWHHVAPLLSCGKTIIPNLPNASHLCAYAFHQLEKSCADQFPCKPFYMRSPDITSPNHG
jgi:tRNA threonylcarbamoyladenosine biosynthesis protein TsaB